MFRWNTVAIEIASSGTEVVRITNTVRSINLVARAVRA
jgi:hypothetical protein